MVFFALVLIAVNYAYFIKGNLPLKYLLPGVVFLFIFQLYTMYFTAYSSFTNYGTGHLGDKEAAIVAIQAQSVVAVEGGPQYAVVPVVKDGIVSMLVTDPATGVVSIATNDGLTEFRCRHPAGRREGHRGHRVSEPEPRFAGQQRRLQRPVERTGRPSIRTTASTCGPIR